MGMGDVCVRSKVELLAQKEKETKEYTFSNNM